jgi:hypothetical protein
VFTEKFNAKIIELKKYNDILEHSSNNKFKEKENLISNNFNDNLYEKTHPIMNLINHFPDIYGHNFYEEILLYDPYQDMNGKIIYIDPITG